MTPIREAGQIMEHITSYIYWIGVLGKVDGLMVAITIVLAISTVVLWVGTAFRIDDINSHDGKDVARAIRYRYTVAFGAIALVLGVTDTFVPSTDTLYAMSAATVATQVAKSPQVQGIASDAMVALQAWMHKQAAPAKEGK